MSTQTTPSAASASAPPTQLNRTPLFAAHLAAGAKMVDFGGWEMPISYGSQLAEHHAVRQKAGMFDVSHMLNVDVTGLQARRFLSLLLANDVAKLAISGKALYSCMLNPEGGVIDDLIVYFFDDDRWRVVVNAGCAQKDIAWMQQVVSEHKLDVVITPRRDLAMIAVQGPQARELVWQIHPEWQSATETLKVFFAASVGNDTLVARTGYTGEDGFEIVLPATQAEALWNSLIAAGVAPCGLGARDTLRLEAGMNLYGQDMDETIQPAQAALTWTVSLTDTQRHFIGREAIESAPRKNVFTGIKLNERGVMRAHMRVRTTQGEGEITSGTMSPTLGVSVAFARLPEGVVAGDTAEVEIRGKWVSATVTALPFVRNGKAVVPAQK
ncbi:glycine cleavage system aminomethyltransferase GcvT [Advenella mimigardefordensis]|nr:glycine cleavage system aminomethyltransferase GcvT [Advenella mimigardefordensis]